MATDNGNVRGGAAITAGSSTQVLVGAETIEVIFSIKARKAYDPNDLPEGPIPIEFEMYSPAGAYSAPIPPLPHDTDRVADFNKQYPNQLQLDGGIPIYFHAERTRIYMDMRTLWCLHWAVGHKEIGVDKMQGFDQILHLAIPPVAGVPISPPSQIQPKIQGLRQLMKPGGVLGKVKRVVELKGMPDALETQDAVYGYAMRRGMNKAGGKLFFDTGAYE